MQCLLAVLGIAKYQNNLNSQDPYACGGGTYYTSFNWFGSILKHFVSHSQYRLDVFVKEPPWSLLNLIFVGLRLSSAVSRTMVS